MFSRKFVLTSCLAIATSMLAGCASYKNESGLPKWLDDASEANRLGYFMGISLKDSPAPEGFDPSKNTLVSDVTFSAAAHGLNAATGAMDIGSFGVELGLSLATNILKREEEEYSQANVYFPAEQFATHEEAYKAALAAMGEKLANALKANGYSIYKTMELSTFGNRYLQLRVEKESVGCRQTKSILDGCAFNVKFDPDDGLMSPWKSRATSALDLNAVGTSLESSFPFTPNPESIWRRKFNRSCSICPRIFRPIPCSISRQ